MKVIGLISGTSSDGVDAALVEIIGRKDRLRLIAFETYPYPKSLQKALIDIASGTPHSVADLCHLNFIVGEQFAEAAKKISRRSGLPLLEIGLIGSHGQTIHHLPKSKRYGKRLIRSTLQIGEPSVIAERTGITTVADFRPRDMAAGGEGAPLPPYRHFHLFSNKIKSRVILNIGGISNITYLAAGAALNETTAFDTGPGNMILDGIVSQLTGGKKSMDQGGRMAKQGHENLRLLTDLMRHPFIKRPPPKSTGREEFGPIIIDQILDTGRRFRISPYDLAATVTAFTAVAIVENLKQFILSRGEIHEVIVGGGGAKNLTLMGKLSEQLSPIPVRTFEEIGFNGRAIEAMTFALLAHQTVHGRPGNIPSVTGARHPVVLGKIIPVALWEK